jgi:integrase
MPKENLTYQTIKTMKAVDKTTVFRDALESGLQLKITPAGNKIFSYRYWIHDRKRRYTIGRFPAISLADARKKVQALKAEINNGVDPQAEKRAKKNAPQPKTFDDLAYRFKRKKFKDLKKSTQKTYANRIDTELIPTFKGMQLQHITRGIIFELLEEICYDREQPIHSNRVRAVLSSMFSYGVQSGMMDYNLVKSIKKLGDEKERDRVLEPEEIRLFWNGFNQSTQPVGSALMMLLLLGQRKTETCRLKWKHIDFNKGLWINPIEENKSKRKHKIPLPTLALAIINDQPRKNEFVFASPRNEGEPIRWLYDRFKRIAEENNIKDVRLHDLRRTAATYMAEMGTDRTILGKILNHKGLAGDSQVTARYDRYAYTTEKRQALNRWSNKLQQIIAGTEATIHKLG